MDTFTKELVMKFTNVLLVLGVSDIVERNKVMEICQFHINPSESIKLHGHLQSMESVMGIMNTILLAWESVKRRNEIADR